MVRSCGGELVFRLPLARLPAFPDLLDHLEARGAWCQFKSARCWMWMAGSWAHRGSEHVGVLSVCTSL